MTSVTTTPTSQFLTRRQRDHDAKVPGSFPCDISIKTTTVAYGAIAHLIDWTWPLALVAILAATVGVAVVGGA